jgi:S-DNA-T family DNA segregation ATPase FtsK/SpoIIIE
MKNDQETYNLLKKILKKQYDLEERVENLEQDKEQTPLTPISEDDLFNEAKKVVIQAGAATASLLQRHLRVGYARAARLIDLLEMEGIIEPPHGPGPRKVLTDPDSKE